jgi:hypothetical protein
LFYTVVIDSLKLSILAFLAFDAANLYDADAT